MKELNFSLVKPEEIARHARILSCKGKIDDDTLILAHFTAAVSAAVGMDCLDTGVSDAKVCLEINRHRLAICFADLVHACRLCVRKELDIEDSFIDLFYEAFRYPESTLKEVYCYLWGYVFTGIPKQMHEMVLTLLVESPVDEMLTLVRASILGYSYLLTAEVSSNEVAQINLDSRTYELSIDRDFVAEEFEKKVHEALESEPNEDKRGDLFELELYDLKIVEGICSLDEFKSSIKDMLQAFEQDLPRCAVEQKSDALTAVLYMNNKYNADRPPIDDSYDCNYLEILSEDDIRVLSSLYDLTELRRHVGAVMQSYLESDGSLGSVPKGQVLTYLFTESKLIQYIDANDSMFNVRPEDKELLSGLGSRSSLVRAVMAELDLIRTDQPYCKRLTNSAALVVGLTFHRKGSIKAQKVGRREMLNLSPLCTQQDIIKINNQYGYDYIATKAREELDKFMSQPAVVKYQGLSVKGQILLYYVLRYRSHTRR